jgi:hypothetical protein
MLEARTSDCPNFNLKHAPCPMAGRSGTEVQYLPLNHMVKAALRISMIARHLHSSTRTFGRREPFVLEAAIAQSPAFGSDIKLFAATYVAGFLMVSIFLA